MQQGKYQVSHGHEQSLHSEPDEIATSLKSTDSNGFNIADNNAFTRCKNRLHRYKRGSTGRLKQHARRQSLVRGYQRFTPQQFSQRQFFRNKTPSRDLVPARTNVIFHQTYNEI